MELDPRIKSLSDVLTCFDIEKAKEFIGQKGYFGIRLVYFSDLKKYCIYGTLAHILANPVQVDPFLKMEGDDQYQFFIPESSLKPKEKKYRPYTPEEFCDKFNVGQQIAFRKKDDKESEQDLILQGLWYKRRDGRTIAYAHIGSCIYTLDELFNEFEWRALFKRDFAPFGVEDE